MKNASSEQNKSITSVTSTSIVNPQARLSVSIHSEALTCPAPTLKRAAEITCYYSRKRKRFQRKKHKGSLPLSNVTRIGPGAWQISHPFLGESGIIKKKILAKKKELD